MSKARNDEKHEDSFKDGKEGNIAQDILHSFNFLSNDIDDKGYKEGSAPRYDK
jgi:hypothetical protein